MLEVKIMGSDAQNFSSFRPFFDGSDYPHWKFKMELYLDSDSVKLWDVVLKGWEPPRATVEGVVTTFSRSQWNIEQKEKNHKNKRAMITLVSSMSREEGGKLHVTPIFSYVLYMHYIIAIYSVEFEVGI